MSITSIINSISNVSAAIFFFTAAIILICLYRCYKQHNYGILDLPENTEKEINMIQANKQLVLDEINITAGKVRKCKSDLLHCDKHNKRWCENQLNYYTDKLNGMVFAYNILTGEHIEFDSMI